MLVYILEIHREVTHRFTVVWFYISIAFAALFAELQEHKQLKKKKSTDWNTYLLLITLVERQFPSLPFTHLEARPKWKLLRTLYLPRYQ